MYIKGYNEGLITHLPSHVCTAHVCTHIRLCTADRSVTPKPALFLQTLRIAEIKVAMITISFCTNYYKSIAIRDITITIYLPYQIFREYFCCNAMSHGDIYHLHQLRRSHCLFDRVLFTRARNLWIYFITRSPCSTANKENVARQNEQNRICGESEQNIRKKLRSAVPKKKLWYYSNRRHTQRQWICVYNCIQHFVHVIILIIYAIMKTIDF